MEKKVKCFGLTLNFYQDILLKSVLKIELSTSPLHHSF